jgi:hypothetical protein
MIAFAVEPYQGAGSFKFGMSEAAVLALGQQPLRKAMNPRKEPDWDFGAYSIRFGADDGLLCEIGFSKGCSVRLDDVDIFSHQDALERILQKDTNVFEFYGFLVFFGLGITLTGFHDRNESEKAMTVFRRGRWDGKIGNPKFRKWG